MNVIKNGLRQDLTFIGALHLSFVDKKVNDYDKLVINVNKNKEEGKTWVDFIVIYGMLGDSWENFRIGGNIDGSVRGHQDIEKWLEMSMKELDWQGSISCLNKDALILNIFNFINGVSDVILTSDTSSKIEYEDGFVIKTFYPWPDDDPEDFNDDEEEIVEEVVEEVVDEEVVEETTEEIIDFKGYDYKCVHERGNNKRSDEYVDKRIGSIIYAVVETDEDGEDHFIGGDILKSSKSVYGGPTRVVSIYNLADVERCRNNLEDVLDRVIKASDLTIEAERILAKDILEHDTILLLDKIQEGLEWKASSQSTNEPVSEYYY